MLRRLPFTMFSEIAALDLVVGVHCPGCHRRVEIDLGDERLRDRCFAETRLRCAETVRPYRSLPPRPCGGLGHLFIRPREPLAVGGAVRLAFLCCRRCVPHWEIQCVPIDPPPWQRSGGGPTIAIAARAAAGTSTGISTDRCGDLAIASISRRRASRERRRMASPEERRVLQACWRYGEVPPQ